MNLRRPALLVVLACLGLLLAACGSVTPYAATVNGTRIDQGPLEDELRAIASNERYLASIEARTPVRGAGQGTFDASFTAQVLTRRIYYVLIDKELETRKLTVTDNDRADAHASVAQQLGGEEVLADFPKDYQDTVVYRTAALNVLALSLNGQNSSEEAARAYYDAHAAEFQEACVSHILLASQETADTVRARLAAGDEFGATALANSEDSASASKNGELRCGVTAETTLPPQFLDAVFTLAVGDVSAPIQTELGWHLIKVTSRQAPPFEQAETRVRTAMLVEADGVVTNFLRQAVTTAEIGVDPRYGSFDKEQTQVVPPGAPGSPTSPGATVPSAPAAPPAADPGASTPSG